MKQAKRVEIPEDRTLTTKEFSRLRDHAVNSASFYALDRGLNSAQIREKLLRKGYIEDDVEYTASDGSQHRFNFIDFALGEVVDRGFVDEEAVAERIVSRCLARGAGVGAIRQAFWVGKVPADVAESVLSKLEVEGQDEVNEALQTALRRAKNSFSYRKHEGDTRAQEGYLRKSLMTKGFGWDDIARVLKDEGDE